MSINNGIFEFKEIRIRRQYEYDIERYIVEDTTSHFKMGTIVNYNTWTFFPEKQGHWRIEDLKDLIGFMRNILIC